MNSDRNKAALEAFEKAAKKPFGFWDKIGYACGDLANNLTFVFVAFFMLKFYTDIMGVNPATVGLMMMLAKVVDAFTDIIMGQIVDRSSYKAKGKFAPWMLYFSGPVSLAFFLIFAPYFADKSMGFKVFWMFFTYLLWGSVCYTGANIPYGSMASAMSDKPQERQSLSTFRNVGAMVGQMIIVVLLPLVVYIKDADGKNIISGSRIMFAALVCAILAFLVYFACYNFSTERIKLITEKKEQRSIFSLLKILVTNRSIVGIILAAWVLLIVQLTLSGMGNYIYPNYFGDASMLSISSFFGIGIVLLLSLFVKPLTEIVGKKEIAAIGAIIGGVTMFIIYFIHTTNVWVYVVLYCIAYIGLGFFNLVCWAMIIDVIDDVEVNNNVRADGTVYSVYSFARKLGQAISQGLTGYLLSKIGYTKETAFDKVVTDGIYNVASLIPAIGFIVMALVLIFIYPLTKAQIANNIEILKKKRGQ